MILPKPGNSLLELNNRIAVLTFQRDDVRNALTGTSLVEDIISTVRWADESGDVSVLIITGSGAAFSSGGNVKDMRDRTGMFAGDAMDIQEQYRHGIQNMPIVLHRAEIPLIAAINGPAIGAGFDLACMCDFRIASTRAVVGETFINLGIIPGDGGAWFLQRLIGYQHAAELTLSGRLLKAEEALDLGLFLKVVEPDKLLSCALELAAQFAAKPPGALRMTKRLLKLAQRTELPDFLETCASFQAIAHKTNDHHEAVAAFLEKRAGIYSGR